MLRRTPSVFRAPVAARSEVMCVVLADLYSGADVSATTVPVSFLISSGSAIGDDDRNMAYGLCIVLLFVVDTWDGAGTLANTQGASIW